MLRCVTFDCLLRCHPYASLFDTSVLFLFLLLHVFGCSLSAAKEPWSVHDNRSGAFYLRTTRTTFHADPLNFRSSFFLFIMLVVYSYIWVGCKRSLLSSLLWSCFIHTPPGILSYKTIVYLLETHRHQANRFQSLLRLQLPLVLVHLERGDSSLHDLPLRNRRLKMLKVASTEMRIKHTEVRSFSGRLTRLRVPA
jgi:hypothetical protein